MAKAKTAIQRLTDQLNKVDAEKERLQGLLDDQYTQFELDRKIKLVREAKDNIIELRDGEISALHKKVQDLQSNVYVEIQRRVRLEGYLDRIKETDQAAQIMAATRRAAEKPKPVPVGSHGEGASDG